jgi:hypothetical protein
MVDDFQFWREVLDEVRILIIQDSKKFHLPEGFSQL